MKSSRVALAGAFVLYCGAALCADVTVSDAWVRATAPGQKVAGGYLKITSPTTAYLVGGSSNAAKAVELHEMKIENNVMKMRPLPRLELPAGTAVELKPGGYHLMLIDIVHPLATGDSVPLTLIVEDSDGKRRNLELTAGVRALAAMGGQHGSK